MEDQKLKSRNQEGLVGYSRLEISGFEKENSILLRQLVDILHKRSYVLGKVCLTPGLAERQADLYRGQALEVRELLKVLDSREVVNGPGKQ